MNVFFLKIKNNDILIGYDGSTSEAVVSTKKNNNVVFLDNEKVVGFNINDFKNIFNLKPGRIILNDEICSYINDCLNVNIKKNNQSFFKVGKVVECKQIEGTHLSLTKIDIGDEKLDIVCGAKNVKKGLKVVVATIGVVMNDGLIIKKGNLRGYDSYGMLCSKKELGLESSKFNSEGIIELDESYKVGDIFYELYANKEK